MAYFELMNEGDQLKGKTEGNYSDARNTNLLSRFKMETKASRLENDSRNPSPATRPKPRPVVQAVHARV